jgi:hypothetical protein
LETDVSGVLSEALTAHVETVLADETGLVSADTAVLLGQENEILSIINIQ